LLYTGTIVTVDKLGNITQTGYVAGSCRTLALMCIAETFFVAYPMPGISTSCSLGK